MIKINYLNNSDAIDNTAVFAEYEAVNSPFMIYDNESLNICQNDYPISLYINDTDKQIVALINKFRILTSMQIIEALRLYFDSDADETYVKNRIKLLVKANYVQLSVITCDDGRMCSARFYSIGYRGRGLIKALGALRISSYIAQIAETPSDVKRIASCNQFLIRSGIPFDAIESGQVVAAQPKSDFKGDLVFRNTAMVTGDTSLFVESVRTSDCRFEKLDNKLDRMKKVVKKRDINVDINNPMLIVVCESISHMKQVLDYLASKRLPFEACCTCDQLTYSVPDNCLYAVKRKRSIFGLPVYAA